MLLTMAIENLGAVQISTVDAFQGAERDIIILSTVRTRNLGFLTDFRRLNVAITRARHHLVICGCERLLRRDNHWDHIIKET
jgi:superfamily I DNA and/or RNA helicase